MYFQKISIPPLNGNRNSEAISEGVGGCYRGLFPGGLSDHEIGELLINNSSVEKAVSYLLLPVFQNKYYNSFALINFRFLGNYPPTPLLSQHFGLCKKYVIMMALERGRWAPRNLN